MSIRQIQTLALVLIVCGSSMIASLDRWQLKGSDEPRYAQVAREMLETGRYILPHLNGQPYPDKPPLYFWLSAACGWFSGEVTPYAARFPSALFGLAVVVLTFFFGRMLFGTAAGMLAAGILVTTEQFFSCTTNARLDTLFSFWITLALYLLYQGCVQEPPRRNICLLGWVSTALAVLSKGPTGLVLPLLTMVVYLFLTKSRHKIPRLAIGTGLVLVAGLCCLWLVPACLKAGADYTRNILLTQSFGRVVEAFAHEAPFYFYLISFPLDFLPWTLFLPAAMLYFWRTRHEQTLFLFPLVWWATVFIFFSGVSGKRNLYLLPLYPAAALLMGKFLSDVQSSEEVQKQVAQWKLFTVPCFMVGVLFISTGALLFALLANLMVPFQTTALGTVMLTAGGIAAFGAGIILLRAQRRHGIQANAPRALLIGCALVSVLWLWWIKPVLETDRPEKKFCETIQKTISPHDALYASFEPEFFNYFLHRYPIPVVRDPAEVERLIRSPSPSYFLVKERDFKRLPDQLKNHLLVLDKADIGHKTIYFLTNTPRT